MIKDFSELQAKLYVLMDDNKDSDVKIEDMYRALYGAPPHSDDKVLHAADARYMQQKLGPVIQRINAKLPLTIRIEPGQLKRTYRLNTNVTVIH